MKNMRFFALALLVAGAYAVNETCGDANGDTSGTDAYACPTGYAAKSGVDASDISANNNGAVEDANTAICCDANVFNLPIQENSDIDAQVPLTFTGSAVTQLVTCEDGYSVGGAASTTLSYTATLNDDGTGVTGTDTKCAARTFASIEPTGVGLIPNSNYKEAVDVTFGTPLTDFACDGGYVLGKKVDTTTDVSITFGAVTATTGAFTTVNDDDNDPKGTVCNAKEYDVGAVITVDGLFDAAIPNSNFDTADLTTTAKYTQGALAFACDEGFTKVSSVTADFVTENFTNGNGKLTIADSATDKVAAVGDICAQNATAPAPAADPAAAPASAADSATDSSASPAALAAAGMA